ncbi:MAG: hypothetical protein HRU31_06175 [Rhodobacteraceae bacterium]|nr:hypothetical protein [Paracoccaceae bacterium]
MSRNTDFSRPLRLIAILIASSIAGSVALNYSIVANSTPDPFVAILASTAAALWVLVVFPYTGRSVIRDVFLIALAFPMVGFLALAPFLLVLPVVPFVGVYVAVTWPFVEPIPTALLYFFGAIAAFVLPRLRR